jgi:hypothetical protein
MTRRNSYLKEEKLALNVSQKWFVCEQIKQRAYIKVQSQLGAPSPSATGLLLRKRISEHHAHILVFLRVIRFDKSKFCR